jgi:zinc transporter
MVALRGWFEAQRVITLRHRRVLAVQDVVDGLARGEGPADAAALLVAVADHLLDRIGQVVEAIEDGVDDLEERVLSADSTVARARLSDLRRQAIALRRYIAPQRDTLGRLHTAQLSWMGEQDLARLRESADRVLRFVEALDAARERAAVTHEELSNQLAEQMNRTMYTLSVVTAIFLPLGLLTGLLGINVGGMPGTDSDRAFWLVVGLIAALGLAQFAWFRWRRLA